MYTLANESLEVQILDPIADQERFGVRYCTGGYIYQIIDANVGELLSGPTYPDSFNWFDGQGIPDAFNLSPLREPTATDPLALIIGIGVCDLNAKEVRTFCEWDINRTGSRIEMRTVQVYQNFAVELERTVTLQRRTVRSHTRIWNRGRQPFPMRWFPHPFYPQTKDDALLKVNLPIGPIDDEAYRMGADGYIERKGWPWNKGCYMPLNHTPSTNLVLLQKHPKLGLVSAVCSFAPTYFPIWGNQQTFSWEPFLERTIAWNQEVEWWIDYEF